MSQAEAYSNVEIFTGIPQPANTGFYHPPAPESSGLLATDQARAVAEVQAALVIAASRPRNELQARDRLLRACQRENFAKTAIYSYPRGGQMVIGPSIRLAEAAARAWGNMNYGFRELSRRQGESECEAYAWDLETNTKAVRQFTVRHRRDVGKSGKDLTSERDIYEIMANQAQRRVRAAILEIIPGDIMEDAIAACEETQAAKVGNIAEAIQKLLAAFEAIGVTRAAIEKRLGHRIDAMQPGQILSFRKIYASIKDEMSVPQDWFDMEVVKTATPVPDTAQEDKPKRKTSKKKEEQKPAPESSEPINQETGDVIDVSAPEADEPQSENSAPQAAPTSPGEVVCPKVMEDGRNPIVEKSDCERCASRDGCPVWEEEDF